MIRIFPTELNFAARLAELRRQPSTSCGAGHVSRFHRLTYGGGDHLLFETTDFRVSISSQLPVTGNDEPWTCQTPARNFNPFAGTACGASFELEPVLPRCVRAVRKTQVKIHSVERENLFAFPFRNHPNPFPYQCSELTDETEPVLQSAPLLRKAMKFAARTETDRDSTSRMDVCSITPKGDVVSQKENVFFRTCVSKLPYGVNLSLSDASRLGRWIRLLESINCSEIALSSGTNAQGRLVHQFASADRKHLFRVIAAARPVPHEFCELFREETESVGGTVDGHSLCEIASLFQRKNGDPLECRFACEDERWWLCLKTIIEPSGGGKLELHDFKFTNPELASASFNVVPRHLRTALTRHFTQKIRLDFKPKARAIMLSEYQLAEQGPEKCERESFIRVSNIRLSPDDNTTALECH